MACSRLCCILSCGLFGRDPTDEDRADERPRDGRRGDGNSPTEQRRAADRRTQPARVRADPRQPHIAASRASGLQPRPPVGRKAPKIMAHAPSFTSPSRVALTLHGASEETDVSQQDEVRVPVATAPPHARKSSPSPRASDRGADRSSVAMRASDQPRASEYVPAARSAYSNSTTAPEQPQKPPAGDGEFWFGGAQQSGPRAAAGDSIKTKNNASAVAKSFSPGAGGLKAKLVPQKRGKGGEDGASTPAVGAGQSPASILGRSPRGRGRGRGGKPAAGAGRNFGGTVVAAPADGDAGYGIHMDESTLRRMGAQGPPIEAVEDDVEEEEHVDK